MARQRTILSLIIVFVATFLISCGGPSVATPPPTYTTAQLEKIQEYVPEIIAVRDRSQEMQRLIESKQWIKIGNFIHGPMGEAKLNMGYVASNLLPKDQSAARKLTKDLFDHLVKIDQAAETANLQSAFSNSQAAFADLDEFLKLLPNTIRQTEES